MISHTRVEEKKAGGFTLLELLIVVSIIAILSVALIFVLNPAETLKKSRDAQRISDLATLKTALGLMLTSSSTPYLSTGNTDCLRGAGATGKVFYSAVGTTGNFTLAPSAGTSANGTFLTTGGAVFPASQAAAVAVNGTGWIPVSLEWLPGGSPVSNLPLDPVNSVATPPNATSTDLTYRYVCQSVGGASGSQPSNVFELDAVLESDTYKAGGTDDKAAKDGGDSPLYYEVGTNLKLLGNGPNFF